MSSSLRRLVKRALTPVLTESAYQRLQAVAMAWDIWRGAWSEPELELIPHVVAPGDTVLDIGANYGLYSYHLRRAVGASGRVHAFEPVPYVAETFRLVARILSFGDVNLVTRGVAEEAGCARFVLALQENGVVAAGLSHAATRGTGLRSELAAFAGTREIQCEVVAVDSYLPDLERVSLIKSDIEGADLYGLRGARRTLQRNLPVVICEINPTFMNEFGLEVEELTEDLMGGLGYRLFQYTGGRLVSRALQDVEEGNWVFVHPTRRAALPAALFG